MASVDSCHQLTLFVHVSCSVPSVEGALERVRFDSHACNSMMFQFSYCKQHIITLCRIFKCRSFESWGWTGRTIVTNWLTVPSISAVYHPSKHLQDEGTLASPYLKFNDVSSPPIGFGICWSLPDRRKMGTFVGEIELQFIHDFKNV